MYRLATLTLGFFLLASPALAQQEASFQRLGDLPGGDVESKADAVTPDGSVVVGESVSENGLEAFRWEDGTMEGLGDLPGGDFWSRAYGVSADGSVVVGRSVVRGSHYIHDSEAFRWEDGVMEGLGFLPGGPNYERSIAHAASSDGSVIVGSSDSANGTWEAFRWEDGVMVGLGDIPGGDFRSGGHFVSADGSVVLGTGAPASGRVAFRWEDGVMEAIGSISGLVIVKTAASADFSVLAGSDGGEVYRWEDGVMENLGWVFTPGIDARPYGVSADGLVLVGTNNICLCMPDSERSAFMWTRGTGFLRIQDLLENIYGLNLTGWHVSGVNGMSDDGTVLVGYAVNPDGNTEAFRAVVPRLEAPENDDITDATVIPTDDDTYEGTTTLHATLEEDEPEPSCGFGSWTTNFSVWWSFTPEDDGLATINTNGSIALNGEGLDTILSLHNASDLSEVACDDDGGDGVQSMIEGAPIVGGNTYLIRVAGYNESTVSRGLVQLTTEFDFSVAGEGVPGEVVQGLTVPAPNPVARATSFTVAVEESQDVTVEVFDVTGRRVHTLREGALASGELETLTLDATALPAGVYAIRATGEDFVETRRVTVVR